MIECKYVWECSAGHETITRSDREPEECDNCGSTSFEYIGEVND